MRRATTVAPAASTVAPAATTVHSAATTMHSAATTARPAAVVLAVAAVLLVATRQTYTVRFTGLGLAPAQLILFALVALWAVSRLLGQRSPNRLGLLSGLPATLLAVVLLSYGVSHVGVLTADQQTSSDQALVRLGLVVGLTFVVPTVIRTRAEIELVLRALVVGGAASAAFALVRFGTGVDIAAALHLPVLQEVNDVGTGPELLRAGLARPQGAAGTPLELGGVLTILIPVALALFFAARRRGERAWPWLLALALLAGGATVTLSRSVFLGLLVAAVLMLPRWSVRRALAAAGAVVAAVVAAAVLAGGLVATVVDLLLNGSDDYSLSSRSDGRAYVWAHFADHFWLGQGPGTYDLTRQPVLDNEYLSQLMEVGVIGVALLVAVLGCALGYALAAARRAYRTGAADVAELANGIVGAFAAVLVVDAVLDTSGFVQVSTLIWLLIGLGGAVWRVAHEAAEAVPAAEPVRPAVGAAR